MTGQPALFSEPGDAPARAAIRTDLDATLFVEAGAGTGKTSALVDRVVSLVTGDDSEATGGERSAESTRGRGDDAWVAIDRSRDPMTSDARAEWCASRTPEQAAKEALGEGIPAAAVVPGHATLDDPQMRARGFFEPVTHPLVGEHFYPSWPVRMSAGPEHFWTGPSPTLGQHTTEVLRELGIDDAELARLADEHVVGTIPRMGR